jgi:hypothetical protein
VNGAFAFQHTDVQQVLRVGGADGEEKQRREPPDQDLE